MRRYWFIAAPILIVVVVAICVALFARQKPTRVASGQPKIKVAVTIFPIADIVKNIGRDYVDVVTLLPPGASPHTFEPTPESARDASGSVVLLKIGLGLDDWSQKIADAAGPMETVELSQNIALRRLDGNPDPHYWLSIANGGLMAKTIADTLERLDPAHAEIYRNNLILYRASLANADVRLRTKFAELQNRDFATFHEAWYYFAEQYGLNVAAAFEPSPGKEPTPQFVASFIQTVREKHIRVIFSEPQLSSAAIAQSAKDLSVTLETLDPIGGSTPETDSYVKMVEYNGEKIFESLQNK